MPRPFQLQGMSIIDTINDINESLSTLMRQISDAITLIVNPVYKSTGGVDWGNFVMQPGAHLDLDDTEDVQPLIQPNVDLAAALQWRQAYQQDMQRYSGVFDIEGGFSLGGTHTATGVSTVIQQATMRLTEIINVLSYRSMRPFGWMMERLNAQYLDQAVLVDFSNDPEAQQAWQSYVTDVQPRSVFGWVRRRIGQDRPTRRSPSRASCRSTPRWSGRRAGSSRSPRSARTSRRRTPRNGRTPRSSRRRSRRSWRTRRTRST
jgi:hypothetical protein